MRCRIRLTPLFSFVYSNATDAGSNLRKGDWEKGCNNVVVSKDKTGVDKS